MARIDFSQEDEIWVNSPVLKRHWIAVRWRFVFRELCACSVLLYGTGWTDEIWILVP